MRIYALFGVSVQTGAATLWKLLVQGNRLSTSRSRSRSPGTRSQNTEVISLSGVGRKRSPTSGRRTRSLRGIKSISISASASRTPHRAGSLPWAIRFELTTSGNDSAEGGAMRNNPGCPASFSLIDFTNCLQFHAKGGRTALYHLYRDV